MAANDVTARAGDLGGGYLKEVFLGHLSLQRVGLTFPM